MLFGELVARAVPVISLNTAIRWLAVPYIPRTRVSILLRPVVPAPDDRLGRPGRDVVGGGGIVGRLAGWLGTLAQICARVGCLPGKHPLPRHRLELRLDLGASRIPAIPRAGPLPPRASWGILAQEILRRESRSGVSAPAGRDSPLLAHGLGHGADLDFFAHGALRNPRLRFGVLRERLLCGGRRRTNLPLLRFPLPGLFRPRLRVQPLVEHLPRREILGACGGRRTRSRRGLSLELPLHCYGGPPSPPVSTRAPDPAGPALPTSASVAGSPVAPCRPSLSACLN